MNPGTDQPLGQLLLHRGYISQEQLQIAVQEQGRHPQLLGNLLVRLGFVSESHLRDILAEKLGQESIDLDQTVISPAALQLLPGTLARRLQVLPLAVNFDAHHLSLAIAAPNDLDTLDQVRTHLKNEYRISLRLASPSELRRAIANHYGSGQAITQLLQALEPDTPAIDILPNAADHNSPLLQLLDALLAEAAQQGASDIHFEPESSFLRIRYRLDGVLRQTHTLHRSFWPTLLVRLKVMSGMNIAETRAPQDGHFSLMLNGRNLDFRTATHPTLHGENLVLRLLDRQKGIVPLDQLGLAPHMLQTLHEIMAKPEGVVLITGPTGSGKTTTLYALLHHLNREAVNIMTLEDPVEYLLPQVRQTSVNENARLDFASGIRSMMRQDPDIILVGEIRDRDTAEMAFRAAMTGHQVYATLHANSAIGALPRLIDIGIAPELLAENLNGVLAQRLVRLLCPHCKRPASATLDERQRLGLPLDQEVVLYRAMGCDACDQQGFRGRRAILEILRPSQALDELIVQRASPRSLRRQALTDGYRPLSQDGKRLVIDGATTLDEILRVADLTEHLI